MVVHFEANLRGQPQLGHGPRPGEPEAGAGPAPCRQRRRAGPGTGPARARDGAAGSGDRGAAGGRGGAVADCAAAVAGRLIFDRAFSFWGTGPELRKAAPRLVTNILRLSSFV